MSTNKAYDIILDPITNIAPSTTAAQKVTRTFPAVANYWDIYLELVNLTAANIQLINLKANNTIIQQWGNVSGASDVDVVNEYNGLPLSSAALTNPIIDLSQRSNRAFGGGIQSLTAAPAGSATPVILKSGSPKDLETLTGLNCNSQDANGNQIATLTLEVYIINTGSSAASITLTGYGCDPYPGGPGLLKFVDYKTYNATAGVNIMDKNSAYNIGDGMRLNLEQIFYIPASSSTTFDQWIHYLQSTPIRQRSQNLNNFVEQQGVIKKPTITGLFAFDTRELLYGDEVLAIGALNTQFRTQVTIGTAGNVAVYQISQGTLFPTAS